MTCIAIRTFIPQAIERARDVSPGRDASVFPTRACLTFPHTPSRHARRVLVLVRAHRSRSPLSSSPSRRRATHRLGARHRRRRRTRVAPFPSCPSTPRTVYVATAPSSPLSSSPVGSSTFQISSAPVRSPAPSTRRRWASCPRARGAAALWAVGGPAAAAGLATGSVVGDVGVTCVASAEIIVGLDFPSAIAPAEIPGPIVAAQTVNLASLVGLRAWQTAERRRRAEE